MTHMTYDSSGQPQFRSRLEQEIANELDAHLVSWGYEMPVVLPDGHSPRYLPDFTIHESPDELQLPAWVEGKPQQFLYDFRDSLGVTRRYGDRFDGEISVDGVDAEAIKAMHIEELWKPKHLAELTGDTVLVVGGVGGTSKLSVEMRPYGVVFSRNHPFVNWPGVQRKLQRERDRQRWAEESRINEIARQRREQEYQTTQEKQQEERLAAIRMYTCRGSTRYDTRCAGCRNSVAAGTGNLYKIDLIGGGSQWVVLCDDCRYSR